MEELDDEAKTQIHLYCNCNTTLYNNITFREFCNQRQDIFGSSGSEKRRQSQYYRHNIYKRLAREYQDKQQKIMSKYNIQSPWLYVVTFKRRGYNLTHTSFYSNSRCR